MTIQTAVLIETLTELGAEVTWSSCNKFSTQDHAAAAIAADRACPSTPGRARPTPSTIGASSRRCIFPDGQPLDLIVDDGGDLTAIVHGAKYRHLLAGIRGLSEETTTGVHRLYQMHERGELAVPAINVNDSVTKSKFDNLYGCRESLADGIKRATDVMMAGKVVVICRLRRRGQGLRPLDAVLRRPGADHRDRSDLRLAGGHGRLRSDHDGRRRRAGQHLRHRHRLPRHHPGPAHASRCPTTPSSATSGTSTWRSTSPGSTAAPDVKRVNIKPLVDRYTFPDGHSILLLAEGRLVNLGCATGHPSFVMSNSFTNQVLAQMALWTEPEKYPLGVHCLPKHLDEEVARLHLDQLGVKLTKLTPKQAEYLGIPVDGPFKPDYYRY